jgi:iron-sulfur cluster insertion protein
MSPLALGTIPTETSTERFVPMSLFTITDASQVFNLTDSAVDKVKGLIADEGSDEELVLRVAVRPGGCSGFSYEMFFDTDVADDDIKSERDGVTVVIDPASQQHLKGATLDYKDGLQGAGFHITNPNAERSCGCGQSFS